MLPTPAPIILAFRVKNGAGDNAWQTVNGTSRLEYPSSDALDLVPYVPRAVSEAMSSFCPPASTEDDYDVDDAPKTFHHHHGDPSRTAVSSSSTSVRLKFRVLLKDCKRLEKNDSRHVLTVETEAGIRVVSSTRAFTADAFAVQFGNYEDFLALSRFLQAKEKPPAIPTRRVLEVLYDVKNQDALGKRLEEIQTDPRRVAEYASDPRFQKVKDIVKWASLRC